MSATTSALIVRNRANAQHSTGPRTEAGKQRSSQNALRHGLTAQTAVLPTENQAAYQQHCRKFLDEHQPATATETQLVQELADTSWRLNRIPLLESNLLERAAHPPTEQAAIDFDIVDAHRLIANLTLSSARLSRQFQKALHQLLTLQSERQKRERQTLRDAAALYEFHKHKGIEWDPARDGFVFPKERIEHHADRLVRRNLSRQVEYFRFGTATYHDAC